MQVFDNLASEYERYRQTYPAKLFDDLRELSGVSSDAKVLEVGSGTGKATEALAQMGFSILCIEPGPDLIRIAKQKLQDFSNVSFRNMVFEEWEPEDRYDLCTSATAFHFLDPQTKYQKVAGCLKERGVFAPFWMNHVPSFSPVFEDIRQVYRKFAPGLEDSQRNFYKSIRNSELEILDTGLFSQVEVRTYQWEQDFNADNFVGLLNTNSSHQKLDPETREGLFEGIRQVIEQHGGRITKIESAMLFVATRK